jgi:uncharacterized protein YbaR (Trm112 family)
MLSPALSMQRLRDASARGENVTQLVREATGILHNTEEIIELSFDVQAGINVRRMRDPQKSIQSGRFSRLVAKEIRALTKYPHTLLEAGVGEATTLSGVLECLRHDPSSTYAFDISWSRIAQARRWLNTKNLSEVHLCTAGMSAMPYVDNAFDVVYTAHSVELNGGSEITILKELHRVTARYLLLFESAYEFASEGDRKLMEINGYCTSLEETCRELKFEIVDTRVFKEPGSAFNATMLLIIKKSEAPASIDRSPYACPVLKSSLVERNGVMVSSRGMLVYPIIDGIPCLRISNAVIASHFGE